MLTKGVFEVLSSRSRLVEVDPWSEITADVVRTSSMLWNCPSLFER